MLLEILGTKTVIAVQSAEGAEDKFCCFPFVTNQEVGKRWKSARAVSLRVKESWFKPCGY